MNDEPLFVQPEDPPMVPPVVFYDKIRWSRIVVLNKPTCGHCQMVVHAGEPMPVQRARWTRVGLDGSILELCEGHTVQQRARDGG